MGMMTDAVQLLLTYKAAIVAIWFALFFLAERALPAMTAPAESKWRRLTNNIGLLAINFLLSPLVVVPISVWAAAAAPGWRPDWWSGGWGLLADLLILDCAIYWFHRANHSIGFLWRFHQVHHLDRHLDTTTGLRFHFGEVLISALFRAALIIALDIPISSVLVFEAALLLASLFHHSNTRLPKGLERVVSLIVVTPSIHRLHHSADEKDLGTNMATILSVWDRLFATRNGKPDSPDLRMGLVGQTEDPPLPGLILQPAREPKQPTA